MHDVLFTLQQYIKKIGNPTFKLFVELCREYDVPISKARNYIDFNDDKTIRQRRVKSWY